MELNYMKNAARRKFLKLAIITVLLYSFLILLVFGFDGGSSFWISFAFANFSIALSYLVSYRSVSSARRLTDWIFSWPIMRWSIIYAIIELIMATVFMIVDVQWKIVFIPQFLLPILFWILVAPCFTQKNHVAAVREETAVKVSYIRQMNAKLIALIPRSEDAALKKDIEKAADMLRHSDPMSADSLAEIEQKMSAYVDQLDTLVREKNYAEATPIAKELCLLIEERNQLVIASKLVQH